MDFVSYWPRVLREGWREIIMITGNILALRRSESGINIKGTYIYIKNRKESFPSTKNILSNIPSPSLYLDPRLISRLGNRTKRGGTGQMERVYRARAKVGQ